MQIQVTINVDDDVFEHLLGRVVSAVESTIELKLRELVKGLPAKEDKLLTVAEVSRKTNFQRATVYKWIDYGKLKSVDFCNKKRIRESDLNSFMDSPDYIIKVKRNLKIAS